MSNQEEKKCEHDEGLFWVKRFDLNRTHSNSKTFHPICPFCKPSEAKQEIELVCPYHHERGGVCIKCGWVDSRQVSEAKQEPEDLKPEDIQHLIVKNLEKQSQILKEQIELIKRLLKL